MCCRNLTVTVTDYDTDGHNSMTAKLTGFETLHHRNDLISTRVVRIWNNLPVDVDFTSVKSFLRAISRINFTIYCDFNV